MTKSRRLTIEELIAAARSVDDTVTGLERKLAGKDLRLSGTVRVATTDSLMGSVLPEILAEFRAAHPQITVELAVSNIMFNLTKRDADVAIRPATDPPETLIGRRVARIAFAIYAASRYLAKRKTIDDLAAQRWVGPDDSLADTSVARWMRSELAESEIALRADSLLALREAAQAGLGLAALPCYLGDTCPGLVCVHPPDRRGGDGCVDTDPRGLAPYGAHSRFHRIRRQCLQSPPPASA